MIVTTLNGQHTRTAHHLLHTQCSRPSMARASSAYLPKTTLNPEQADPKLSLKTQPSLTGVLLQEFVKAYYTGVLRITNYLMRFKRQHHRSPHVHGLAWLPDAPNVEQLLSSSDNTPNAVKEDIIKHADQLVSIINPAVLPDGSTPNAMKKTSSSMQINLSPPSIQQFYLMKATLMMHHL